jgi:hypothetical protein
MARTLPTLARLVALLALTIGLAAGCSIGGSQVVDGEGIIGTYTVNGVDPVGIEYSGTVVIDGTDTAGTYTVQWIVTGAISEGVGTLAGDRFDVTWTSVTTPRGDTSGTASYTVDNEGNLVGTRTIDGVDGVGTEEIFQQA